MAFLRVCLLRYESRLVCVENIARVASTGVDPHAIGMPNVLTSLLIMSHVGPAPGVLVESETRRGGVEVLCGPIYSTRTGVYGKASIRIDDASVVHICAIIDGAGEWPVSSDQSHPVAQ